MPTITPQKREREGERGRSPALSDGDGSDEIVVAGRGKNRRLVVRDSDDSDDDQDKLRVPYGTEDGKASSEAPQPAPKPALPDEPDEEIPVAGRGKHLRLIVRDSDDEDGDGEDTLPVPCGTREGRASSEDPDLPASAPSPSNASHLADDEIDVILRVKVKADECDEAGDDHVSPGPEGDDENDIPQGIESRQPVTQTQAAIFDSKFAEIVAEVIGHLKDWADGHNLVHPDVPETKAMTFGYWSLLRRLSVEYILKVFIPAVPLDVQALFEKETWSVEDFLSLSYAEDNERQGIYCNFAMGDIAYSRDIGCDAYVGSTRCLRKRIGQHLATAEGYSVNELPRAHRGSLHYAQICRDGVQSRFRKLASFDASIESGYLLLLEGIFMILLDTYKFPGYYSIHSSEESYNLTKEIRMRLNLPEVSWRGMNAAWPLRQGFFNRGAKSESQCCNPACDRMTYPRDQRPGDAIRGNRQPAEQGNPLGGYICSICARYRYWHNAGLPDARVLARFKQRLEARAAAGANAACRSCGRLESQLPAKPLKRNDGREIDYTRKHRVHPGLLGELLCEPCYHFFDLNKRLKNEKEVQDLLDSYFLVAARLGNGIIRCQNPDCGVIEGSRYCGRKNHIANRRTRKVLCQACDGYERAYQKLRNRAQVQSYVAEHRVQEARAANRDIVCGNNDCKAVEGTLKNKKPFAVNSAIAVVLCPACNGYYGRYKHMRSAQTIQVGLKSDQLADDRKNQRTIVCDKCSDIEEMNAKKKFGVNSDNLTVECPRCRGKRLYEKQKRAQQERVEV